MYLRAERFEDFITESLLLLAFVQSKKWETGFSVVRVKENGSELSRETE